MFEHAEGEILYGRAPAFAPNEKTPVAGYFEFGVGYGDHVMTVEYEDRKESESLGRFLLVTQLGAIVPFGKSGLGLDIGGALAMKLFGDSGDEGTGFVLAAHLGLVSLFGREYP